MLVDILDKKFFMYDLKMIILEGIVFFLVVISVFKINYLNLIVFICN